VHSLRSILESSLCICLNLTTMTFPLWGSYIGPRPHLDLEGSLHEFLLREPKKGFTSLPLATLLPLVWGRSADYSRPIQQTLPLTAVTRPIINLSESFVRDVHSCHILTVTGQSTLLAFTTLLRCNSPRLIAPRNNFGIAFLKPFPHSSGLMDPAS
jgi:hypothetical protein